MAGLYYNTAAVIDATAATWQVPQEPHPRRRPLLGKVLLPARQPRLPGLRHRGRQGRRLHLLRPALPRGWRELGLNGAEIVFNPSATKPGLSNRLWELEQPAAAAANQYFVAANNRIGTESGEFGDKAVTFYGSSYFADPRGNYVGEVASTDTEEIVIRDLDLDLVRTVRNDWQFYRDRRPDSYDAIPAR